MLEIKGLTHGFGERVLYENVNIRLNKGEKVGLVGLNGTGKTTLINIINGNLIFDKGSVIWEKRVKVGYLDQQAKVDENLTVMEYLKLAFADLLKKEQEYYDILELMSIAEGKEFDDLLIKSNKLFEYIDSNDIYSVEAQIKKVASGLGVEAFGYNTKLSNLSGGQRAKCILTKLLLDKPDVLILDEPTNFLDSSHIEWLSKYLKNLDGTFIIVSHDIAFLDSVTTIIWEISNKNITRYNGNYSAYLKQKELQKVVEERTAEKTQEKVEKLEDFIARHRTKTYSARQAQSRIKQLNKIEQVEIQKETPMPKYSFQYSKLSAHNLIQIKDMSIGYNFPLIEHINLLVKNGEKLRICGFNGLGKTTFIRTIMNEIPSLAGTMYKHPALNVGYFHQEIKWYDDSLTPIEEIRINYPDFTDKKIRSCLANVGLPTKLQMQPLNSLSGGEQTKVKLCKFIISPFNLLILDEPTNHLDVKSKEALANAIINFPGTVIFVSHDEDFSKKFEHTEFNLQNLLVKRCKKR